MINNRAVSKGHVPLYDRKEYERRVKAVLEGNILESTIRETANMLGRQIDLLNGIPLDVLRNNSNKLVNQDKAESHLIRLTSRMEWFPVVYHLVDNVALVVFTVLGYYTGKHHLNDDLVFLWLLAAMPVLIVSVIWGINELMAWMNGK